MSADISNEQCFRPVLNQEFLQQQTPNNLVEYFNTYRAMELSSITVGEIGALGYLANSVAASMLHWNNEWQQTAEVGALILSTLALGVTLITLPRYKSAMSMVQKEISRRNMPVTGRWFRYLPEQLTTNETQTDL